MPKTSEFVRFRTVTKVGPAGQKWVSYWYDGRGTGWPDQPLGKDKAAAIERWREIRAAVAAGQKPPKARAARVQRMDRAPVPAKAGKRRNFFHPGWAAAPAWAKPLYLMVEARSRRDGRPSFLSPAEYLAVVDRAAGLCEVTGIPFDLSKALPGRRAPFAPSLDRIDCARGYLAGNVRLVAVIINCALGDFGEDLFEIAARAFLRARCGSETPASGSDGAGAISATTASP